jgi:hypothetical protein
MLFHGKTTRPFRVSMAMRIFGCMGAMFAWAVLVQTIGMSSRKKLE